jgi:hypothetical protein
MIDSPTLQPALSGSPDAATPDPLGLQRTIEDWEADPQQDTALDAALAHDNGPAATRILAAIQAGTY